MGTLQTQWLFCNVNYCFNKLFNGGLFSHVYCCPRDLITSVICKRHHWFGYGLLPDILKIKWTPKNKFNWNNWKIQDLSFDKMRLKMSSGVNFQALMRQINKTVSLRICESQDRKISRSPSVDQIKACRLFDAKPLSKPLLVYCYDWSLGNKFWWN